MLRPGLAVALVASLALAGCFGSSPSESTKKGAYSAVTVHNKGPHDALVTLTVILPNGTVQKDSFTLRANATAQHDYTTGNMTSGQGTVQVRLDYTWDESGGAATGHLDMPYDATKCAGAYGIDFTIETTPHKTASSSTGACKA